MAYGGVMVIESDRTGTWRAYGKTASNLDKLVDDNTYCFDQPIAESVPLARNSRFLYFLDTHFPEVAATIDQKNLGVLHEEVGALTFATRDAISKSVWSTVSTHFAFVDSVLESADTELHDAIGVHYLKNLFYDEISLNYAKARLLMPKRLATALEIIERHYEELTK